MLKSISQNFQRFFGTGSGCETTNKMAKNLMHDFNIKERSELATFGMGCFWSSDCLFGATSGVLRTRVGYSGGDDSNKPAYKNLYDHTEVLEIEFDPSIVSYDKLLQLFWNNHEYGLCKRLKRQYMSLILYHNENQMLVAQESRKREQEKRLPNIIITEIRPAQIFYQAEDYHQKYRLQGHKELVKSLELNAKLLQTSHVAAKLNGYIGFGGITVTQFLKEADHLGLTESQTKYIKEYIERNEFEGLSC